MRWQEHRLLRLPRLARPTENRSAENRRGFRLADPRGTPCTVSPFAAAATLRSRASTVSRIPGWARAVTGQKQSLADGPALRSFAAARPTSSGAGSCVIMPASPSARRAGLRKVVHFGGPHGQRDHRPTGQIANDTRQTSLAEPDRGDPALRPVDRQLADPERSGRGAAAQRRADQRRELRRRVGLDDVVRRARLQRRGQAECLEAKSAGGGLSLTRWDIAGRLAQ